MVFTLHQLGFKKTVHYVTLCHDMIRTVESDYTVSTDRSLSATYILYWFINSLMHFQSTLNDLNYPGCFINSNL